MLVFVAIEPDGLDVREYVADKAVLRIFQRNNLQVISFLPEKATNAR